MPLLRGSEPGDGLDGILACTLEVDEPRAPISDQWTTMPVSGPLKVPATMTPWRQTRLWERVIGLPPRPTVQLIINAGEQFAGSGH